MCICIDINEFGNFLKRKKFPDMQLIHDWLDEKKGKIVYTDEEQFRKEFHAEEDGKCWKALTKRREAGKARFVRKELLPKVDPKGLISNDAHIIALCMASHTKLLLTADKDLQKDFKRLIDGGNIYQHQHHATLLTPDTCLTDESDT